MKRATILLLSLIPLFSVADVIPEKMLVCTNSFFLDKAFNDLMKGQQMVLDEMLDKGQCGFVRKEITGVEIEKYGAVIKARFREAGQVHTVYYSAAELLLMQQQK